MDSSVLILIIFFLIKMKNTVLTLFALLFVFQNYAQKIEDLGNPKPFSIGLKGTIYKYTVPKSFKSATEWDYKPEIEQTLPIICLYAIAQYH